MRSKGPPAKYPVGLAARRLAGKRECLEMQEDMYCKVYVDGASNVTSLATTIADVVDGRLERRTVQTPLFELDIFDQSRHSIANANKNFVHWPAYLEVFAADGIGFDAFVVALGQMLNGLSDRGLQVVASCDFEDELAAARRG
jgi:hypothetical protein